MDCKEAQIRKLLRWTLALAVSSGIFIALFFLPDILLRQSTKPKAKPEVHLTDKFPTEAVMDASNEGVSKAEAIDSVQETALSGEFSEMLPRPFEEADKSEFSEILPQPFEEADKSLLFDFTVNDSWSYSCDTIFTVETNGNSHTNRLSYTLAETVTQDNQDGSFNIDVDITNMLLSKNSGEVQKLPDRSDVVTVVGASGQIKTGADSKNLIDLTSLLGKTTWNGGTVRDDDGLFVPTAVNVNDSWYVNHTTTPYGQSAQTVTATATLLKWTTLNGYNVAKIRYTWTEPVHQKRTFGTEAYLQGNLDCERIVYFACAERKVVKAECNATGTLTYIEGERQGNMDFCVKVAMLLN